MGSMHRVYYRDYKHWIGLPWPKNETKDTTSEQITVEDTG